jgi:hypothetical protein
MSNQYLKKFARIAIGKTLGLTVATKNIVILNDRCGIFGTVIHLEFRILGFDTLYILKLGEFGNDNDYHFIICNGRTDGENKTGGVMRFVLKQEDLKE